MLSSSIKKRMSLSEINLANTTTKELINIFNKILGNGIHGISFSAYLEGQGPGSQITEEQIHSFVRGNPSGNVIKTCLSLTTSNKRNRKPIPYLLPHK